MKARQAKLVRCAIYTRVSTDQGLEQDFNSLDAQYDASQAYIRSQAHAGWTLVRSKYDDGGFFGGNTDRPALQRLLDDVRAGKVDIIVLYKVDRLTRSLADFAKLVELFDQVGAWCQWECFTTNCFTCAARRVQSNQQLSLSAGRKNWLYSVNVTVPPRHSRKLGRRPPVSVEAVGEFRSREGEFCARVSGRHFSISVAARLTPVRQRPETGSLNGYALVQETLAAGSSL